MKGKRILYALVAVVFPLLLTGQSPRKSIDINDNWLFKGKSVSGDSINATVSIPHTWNDFDAVTGFDYYRGKGIYQKTFIIPKDFAGKRMFLRFSAVQSVADVYWNGVHLGKHRGGYSAFIYEVTDFVKIDSTNTVRVIADNTKYDDVLPLGGDFNIFGGITRIISLFATDKICISPLDFASSGIYLKQRSVSEDEANICEEILVANGNSVVKNITILTTICDPKGQNIITFQKDEKFLPGETRTIRQTLLIPRPNLWNGKADPYLYGCKVQLIDNGKTADEIIQPLGIRYFKVDPDSGFYLNGNHLSLKGVSRHNDFGGKASALLPENHRTDLGLMLEMGVNAVRLAHYQHDEYFYSLLDSSGIVAWSEIPFVGSMIGGYTNSDAFRENAKQQLTELIKQNYNHPSVCFWGIFNELNNPRKNSPVNIVKSLNELAGRLDSTRLTTAASFINDNDSLTFITDLIAWNKYFGWYYGTPAKAGSWADKVHSKHPEIKIAISEYGAGGSISQHKEKFARPFPISHYFVPEEYQADCHEGYWAEIAKRPFIWGSFIWNMFDFSVAFRNEGDTPARNNKGMVTYDRKNKKDVFYFYKANWNPDPMVYICNKRFIQRSDRKTHVKVYSNAGSVELFVNGQSLGAKKGINATFEWETVILNKGNNSIKAVTVDGNNIIEDTCIWYYRNNAALNTLIWFLRVGIKPFFAAGLVLIALFIFYARRLPVTSWKRKLVKSLAWIFGILMVLILAVFILGLVNGMNIFDYSII